MATYRYWRYKATRWASVGTPGTDGPARVSEIQFVTAANVAYPTSPMTGASAPSPYVVTDNGGSGGGFDPWHAFDGTLDDSHRWLSNGSPSYLTIDMGASYLFTKFRLAPDAAASAGYFPMDFQVLASDTGVFGGEEKVMLNIVGLATDWANSTFRDFTLTEPEEVVPNEVNVNATLPALQAKAFAGPNVQMVLPAVVAYVQTGGLLKATLPSLVASVNGGAQLRASLPALKFRATAHHIDPPGITAVLPALTMRAVGGADIAMQLPALRASASGTVTNLGIIRMTLPALVAAASGQGGSVASIAMVLPMIQVAGRTGWAIRAKLPALQASGSVTVGSVASIRMTLPRLVAVAAGTLQNTVSIQMTLPALRAVNSGVLRMVLPMLRVNLRGGPVIAVTYEAYAINLRPPEQGAPLAVTRYTAFPFTRIVRYRGAHYGVGTDGLYLLGGDTDAGAPIAWRWTTHLDDLESFNRKTVPVLYLGGRLGPASTTTLIDGERATWSYPVPNVQGPGAKTYRLKYGRGLKSTYVGFGLEDETGGAMTVLSLSDREPRLSRPI